MKRFLHILAGLVVPALGANPVAIAGAKSLKGFF